MRLSLAVFELISIKLNDIVKAGSTGRIVVVEETKNSFFQGKGILGLSGHYMKLQKRFFILLNIFF